MKDLLFFILNQITGSEDFVIEEKQDGGKIDLFVKCNSDLVGLVIGKEGKTIKSIRKILSIKASNEKTVVSISIN